MAGRAQADARVAAMLARHGGSLMRVARQWSLCHDDALDAFQRGLEIYVRRMDSVEPATEAAWLKVVIRHEAMAIRRARADCVADPDLDVEAAVPAPQRSVEEQVLSGDRVSRSAEALRALKPDEARALMLKAHGMSYEEIGRHCGWTYTKVNRAITEGRRRFMQVYAALEEGAECERFAPVLSALAAGTATSDQLVEIRPHLRRCAACRATIRDLHRPRLRVVLPLPAIASLAWGWLRGRFRGSAARVDELVARVPGGRVHGLDSSARIDELVARIPRDGHVPALDPSAPDAARIEALASPPGSGEGRLALLERVKQQVVSFMHRINGSDLAATIHMAATSGSGRLATLGAIVGVCLGGVGASTVCLVTGVLSVPFGLGGDRHGASIHAGSHRTRTASSHRTQTRRSARVTATPTGSYTLSTRSRLRAVAEAGRTGTDRRMSTSQRAGSRHVAADDSSARHEDPADTEFSFEGGDTRDHRATPDRASTASATSPSTTEFAAEPSAPPSSRPATEPAPTSTTTTTSNNRTDAAEEEFGP